MLDSVYRLKDSVDVYTILEDDGYALIEFYRINTREKKRIKIHTIANQFLASLDGTKSIKQLANQLNIDLNTIQSFITFLLDSGFIMEQQSESVYVEDKRYIRQIAFFDDLSPNRDGLLTQEMLFTKSVVIFGVGSVGANIAILLARAGIKNFTFVDFKKIEQNSKVRHLYVYDYNIGMYKCEALKHYIKKIDKSITINCINKKLVPNSNLDEFVPKNASIVINTADEPYIGHTSIKLGRYLWQKNIAMYVAGGFNAHSMSTGEIIIPHITPCIDCYSNTFQNALKNWKPIYSKYKSNQSQNKKIEDIIIGGAGSLAGCSLFSASYATISIIYYILDISNTKDKRGEYLINQGKFSWVNLTKDRCNVCK
jgi:molybdopterin/thiamine biosynthesis adenylyltransferase